MKPLRLFLVAALACSGAFLAEAEAGAPRGVRVHRVELPASPGLTLRPVGAVTKGAESRPGGTRKTFGEAVLDVRVTTGEVVIKAGQSDGKELEITVPYADDIRPPLHAIGPARPCGDDLFVAVELEMLPELRSESHRYQTQLIVLSMPRSGKRRPREIGRVTGGSSSSTTGGGWVLGTEVVLDEECNLWAIEAERSWGLDPWKPEDAAFWSLDVGSETLCVNEGNGERTVFHQMPLDAAASRDPSAERPEESSPLLMVFGADYNPGRDPLPRGKFRARCAWSPAPPPPAE